MPSILPVAARIMPVAPLLLAAADAAPSLAPGAWTFTNTPTAATLDGRVLQDLPVGAISSETTCLTPALARRPAAWLARDLVHDCTLDPARIAGGRIVITGHCPAREPGFAAGTLRIAGRYTATRYDLSFTTTSPDENGIMAFSGRMTGHRTGACPADVKPADDRPVASTGPR